MRIMNLQLIISLFLMMSTAYGSMTPVFKVDGSTNLTMMAGKKANWTLKYIHNTNGMKMTHKMFMSMHAKKMHMIIVSKDLSKLAHIHPYLNKESGEFKIKVNEKYSDFDNSDTLNALGFESSFYIFTEVMPMFHDGRESSMLFNRFEIDVKSSGNEVKPLVVADKFEDARLGLTKYFKKDGTIGDKGDEIKVVFKYEQFAFCDRYLPKFYFTIFKISKNGEYLAVDKFDRWLDMGGHAILLSAENKFLKNKTFHHLHAFLPMATKGKFVFPFHDHINPFLEGNYKIWAQMRICNQVYKFPFSFKYILPKEIFFQRLSFCFR